MQPMKNPDPGYPNKRNSDLKKQRNRFIEKHKNEDYITIIAKARPIMKATKHQMIICFCLASTSSSDESGAVLENDNKESRRFPCTWRALGFCYWLLQAPP